MVTEDGFQLWTDGALLNTEDDNIWADKREVINGYQDNYVSQGKSIDDRSASRTIDGTQREALAQALRW